MRGILIGASLLLMAQSIEATGPRVVALPGKSQLVTFRIAFRTGSANDPAGKEGIAALTASMLANGGSKRLTYQQILEELYPMAVSVSRQVDKELTVFRAQTHVDNLEAFYAIFRAMLLEPGWRADDLKRLSDQQVNYLRVALRGNNDEELGKEALYELIYEDHPYGHQNEGHARAVAALTREDLQQFYRAQYTRSNLILGVAGGYPADFVERMKKDFSVLPEGEEKPVAVAAPVRPEGNRILMIEKPTRSAAFSIGFPIGVKRGDPDFPALLVATAALGQHRNSSGRLYRRMRELRGLNYGDYAYLEYFPRGMFLMEPEPNLPRQRQIYQLWIRPVEPPTAHFALRLALFELERFVRDGLGEEEFRQSRSFAAKFTSLLLSTKDAELGYAIDSAWYGIPAYDRYVRDAVAKLTREDVNRAIRRHLRAGNLDIVVVARGCEELRQRIVANELSPMTYNSAKSGALLEDDKLVERLPVAVKPENVRIVPVETVFE